MKKKTTLLAITQIRGLGSHNLQTGCASTIIPRSRLIFGMHWKTEAGEMFSYLKNERKRKAGCPAYN
jgi:hypothetical protein